MNRAVDRQYYLEQLGADVLDDPDAVLARRCEAFGIAATARTPKPGHRERTPELAAQHQRTIETVRGEFWKLPIDELNSKLSAIDVAQYPELATVVERLKRAADARVDFPQAAVALKKNLEFFNFLRQSISLSPRDYAGLREMVSREMTQNNKSRPFQKAARVIESKFPRIHAMDPGWFEEVMRTKPLGSRLLPVNFSLPIPGWILFVIGFTLIRGCYQVTQ